MNEHMEFQGLHGFGFLGEIGVVLVAAFCGGLLARALRLPVLVGYLLAGLVVGPHTPGFSADELTVKAVADLGIVLLMFAVGVQFSLDELKHVRRTALVGGGVQVGGTILIGIVLGLCVGWGLYGGLFLGCALSLTSTAVMLKLLEERGELASAHGSVMMGISVVEDLSAVLMVALLPSLAAFGQADGAMAALAEVGVAILKAGIFLVATVFLATRGVPALLGRVARTGSRELFLLGVICLCSVAAFSAERLGLGLALGAFLAGIVVSESGYAHEVFSQVRPLRDVFASLFFVSVGMMLDPEFVLSHAGIVTAVVLAILIGKSLVSMAPLHYLGWQGKTVILAGLGMAQIGEFSFVLATMGAARGLIGPEVSGVILAAALVSILLAPFVYGGGDRLYRAMMRRPALARLLDQRYTRLASEAVQTERAAAANAPTEGEEEDGPRVLVLGAGRVGRYVSDALKAKHVPHTVVDYDVNAAARLRQNGGEEWVHLIFGDVTSETVLAQADPAGAALAIVALPEAATSEMAVRLLKRMAPDLPVVVRVHRGYDIPVLRRAGADAVIHAEFEASTEMIRQGLDRLGLPDPEVDAYIEKVRQHRYRREEEEDEDEAALTA
jgi:Kef-type K+ transport system, predicted NAD-binding component